MYKLKTSRTNHWTRGAIAVLVSIVACPPASIQSFVCRVAECRELPTRQFAVIVKMDGTILEPKRIVEVD